MRKRNRLSTALAIFFIAFTMVPAANAALNAVDPGPYTAATGFFPLWYQDSKGVPLELCLQNIISPDPAALGGPMCVLLAGPGFDPALPIAFPGNFPDEAFWFTVDARVRNAGRFDVRIIINLEAAFSPEGAQISFARVRLRGEVEVPGVYTFTHPYGVEVLNITDTGSRGVNYTRDIGIGVAGTFTGALSGDIGPFLVKADSPGGAPTPILIGSDTFLGDPNVDQWVTGSTIIDAQGIPQNYFRAQGPGGIDLITDLFKISGKVFKGEEIPAPVSVDRTSYSRSLLGTQMDIFSTGPETAIFSFADSSAPPVIVPMNAHPPGKFFGQAPVPPATLGPVTLTSNNTPYNLPSMPANSTGTYISPVTDLVFITRAEYNAATQTLEIEASSSDEIGDAAGPVALTATGFGDLVSDPLLPPPTLRLTIPGIVIPPAVITVTSTAGGSDTEEVIYVP